MGSASSFQQTLSLPADLYGLIGVRICPGSGRRRLPGQTATARGQARRPRSSKVLSALPQPEQLSGRKARITSQGEAEMIADAIVAGIDISKDWLDVHVAPQGQVFRLANSASGHKSLIEQLRRQAVRHVGLEA